MDAEFKATPGFLNSTLTVRRATSIARSGQTETLGAAVVFACYAEKKSRYVEGENATRVTEHFHVVDAVDVAASALLVLRDTDMFWIEGDDATKLALANKPKQVEAKKDPETGVLSHYEVIL